MFFFFLPTSVLRRTHGILNAQAYSRTNPAEIWEVQATPLSFRHSSPTTCTNPSTGCPKEAIPSDAARRLTSHFGRRLYHQTARSFNSKHAQRLDLTSPVAAIQLAAGAFFSVKMTTPGFDKPDGGRPEKFGARSSTGGQGATSYGIFWRAAISTLLERVRPNQFL